MNGMKHMQSLTPSIATGAADSLAAARAAWAYARNVTGTEPAGILTTHSVAELMQDKLEKIGVYAARGHETTAFTSQRKAGTKRYWKSFAGIKVLVEESFESGQLFELPEFKAWKPNRRDLKIMATVYDEIQQALEDEAEEGASTDLAVADDAELSKYLSARLGSFVFDAEVVAEMGRLGIIRSNPRALRDYQLNALHAAEENWDAGNKRVMIVSATGTGKTAILVEAAMRFTESGGNVLIVEPTQELIRQTKESLVQGGFEDDAIGTLFQRGSFYKSQPVLITTPNSAHKIAAGGDKEGQWIGSNDRVMVIIDEAHHASCDTLRALAESLNAERVLGVTATPIRSDGRGLGEDFDALVNALTVAEAVERKVIRDISYIVPASADLELMREENRRIRALKKKAKNEESYADLTPAEKKLAEESLMRVVGSVPLEILKHASARQGIIFAISRAHSRALCEVMNAAGIVTRHVDGETPFAEREEALRLYRSGEIQWLSNVALFTEGVDAPGCSAIAICRPTGSPGLYAQMVGRAVRQDGVWDKALCLDFTDTVERHGPVAWQEGWTLEADKPAVTKTKVGRSPVSRTCDCGHTYSGGPICPSCGAAFASAHAFAANARALEADLVEMDVEDPKLSASKRKKAMTDEQREKLYGEMLTYAVHQTKTGKAGQAYFWYKEMFGTGPSPRWAALPAPVTPENAVLIANHIKSRRIAWAKSQKNK
jgi:superfamily II DNA or RNA helicase